MPSLAIVAELSKVWIVGQVKRKRHTFHPWIGRGRGYGCCLPRQNYQGKIYHVNEIVNEETRSVEVLVECENPNHDLKPGIRDRPIQR